MNKPLACLVAVCYLVLSGCGSDDGPEVAQPQSGEITLMSGGIERSFYLLVPDGYESARAANKPLLFAFHGTTGNYDLWLEGYYDLLETVGDEAIILLPQALPDGNGVTRWNFDYDLQYFQDLLAYADQNLNYDKNRVFVTGHSNGGGMAHEVGCQFGDRIRAIAVHSGILKSSECGGGVAVLATHGAKDTLVPSGTGEAGKNFWVLYNGFPADGDTTEGLRPFCIDYSAGSSSYPVQWCLHQEDAGDLGHDWPTFASAATWEFFTSLPLELESVDPPPNGGNSKTDSLAATTFTFTLLYPDGIGAVTQGSIGLYPAGTQQPLTGGPSAILNFSFDPGAVGPGSEVPYEVPIKFTNQVFPGTYALAIVIYVSDGGNPIPLIGKDHIVLTDVAAVSRRTPVVIANPLLLEVVR